MTEPELYYIQNAGRPVGNCARWWCEGGHGYTSDLAKAWKVTAEQAASICKDRPKEDIAWPVATIDRLAETHLDVQKLTLIKKPAPACRFYGYHSVRENQILVAQGGNECALIEERYAPCCMEMAGQQVDWDLCVWNTPGAKFTTDRLDTYKRHEWAT
jgi:hypothetical protein